MRGHTFHYDKVVLGGSLEAVLYAYTYDLPIIYKDSSKPFVFEFLDYHQKIDKFYIARFRRNFKGANFTHATSNHKLDLYEHLIYMLSIVGNAPFTSMVATLRFEDNDTIAVVTHNATTLRVKFNELHVFCPDEVELLNADMLSEEPNLNLVVDWINVRSGQEHEYDMVENENMFVKTIFFYPSIRTLGNFSREKRRKDAVVLSYLTQDEIDSGDFDQVYVKMQISEDMKKLGIKGSEWGWLPNGKKRTMPVKVEPVKREIKKISRTVYADTDILKFKNFLSFEDVYTLFLNADLSRNRTHELNRKLYENRSPRYMNPGKY